MLADLKLRKGYDGFIYLADASRTLPHLQSHQHRELELNLVIEGTITYLVNQERFTCSPHTQLWLHPGNEHQLIARSDNARFYVVVFTPSLIRRACHLPRYEGLKAAPRNANRLLSAKLDPQSFDLISKTMAALMHESLDADLLNREAGFGPASDFRFEHQDRDALNAGLHYLLLLCWRCQVEAQSASKTIVLHPAVRRAIRTLGAEDRGQSLEEIARAAHTSKSYLSRIFHRQIGVPLSRYRNSLRLTRFFEVYKGADQPTMAEAVYAAGFGSYPQFYKVFKEAYGCGPRESLTAQRSRGASLK